MALSAISNVGSFGNTVAGGSVSTSGLSSGASGAGSFAGGALSVGIAAFSFANSMSAISGATGDVRSQAAQARSVAIENNELEVNKIEMTSFRAIRRMTAQAGSGGFAIRSQSTLALFNQTANDAGRLEIQSFKKLDATLQEIQRQESAAMKKLRGAKSMAIGKLAVTVLGAVAAPFTGGASLLVAGAATAAV